MNYLSAIFCISALNLAGWAIVTLYMRRIFKSACVLDCLSKEIRSESNRPPSFLKEVQA